MLDAGVYRTALKLFGLSRSVRLLMTSMAFEVFLDFIAKLVPLLSMLLGKNLSLTYRNISFRGFSGVFFVVNSCTFCGLQDVGNFFWAFFCLFANLFRFSVCSAVPFQYLIVSNTNCYTYIRLLENFV